MPLSELEVALIQKTMTEFVERISPPVAIRDKLDIGYRLSGQSVEIFEVRPCWDVRRQRGNTPPSRRNAAFADVPRPSSPGRAGFLQRTWPPLRPASKRTIHPPDPRLVLSFAPSRR